MDVWEHAFLLDYKPSERKAYIESFFSNIHWKTVDERLQTDVPAYAGSDYSRSER
jgi:Fe-Mn family superoxide dismutase